MIEPGQYVKIIFKNATQAEGWVEEWTDKQSVLCSDDGLSKFVIFNTQENILGVKICFGETKQKPQEKLSELEEQFEEVYEHPSADDLRLHSLAQLKTAMNEQEKKIIAGKLKEHSISGVKQSQYEAPSFLRKKK